MQSITVTIEYEGNRRMTARDISMALADYFGRNPKMHISSVAEWKKVFLDMLYDKQSAEKVTMWDCKVCTAENSPQLQYCSHCGRKRQ